jgi:hypothetical protein
MVLRKIFPQMIRYRSQKTFYEFVDVNEQKGVLCIILPIATTSCIVKMFQSGRLPKMSERRFICTVMRRLSAIF